MQLEQLQYLIEIERAGSISSAAHNLHVSQSAVSKSISRLEKSLGLSLFTRLPTGITPTHAGRQLIEKAKDIMGKVQEFDELAKEFSDLSSMKITIACVPMFSQLLSQSLELLMSSHNHMRIEITEKNSKEILQDVRNQAVDVGFMVVTQDLVTDHQLKYNVLLETNMYVCVNRNSPLAQRTTLHPEDLLNELIVSYNGSIIDRLNLYFNNGESMRYTLLTNNLESIKLKITQGTAISILSKLTINNHGFLTSGDILAIPILIDSEPIKLKIASVKLKQNSLTRIFKDLLKILEKEIVSSVHSSE